jgi:hypothetical protein
MENKRTTCHHHRSPSITAGKANKTKQNTPWQIIIAPRMPGILVCDPATLAAHGESLQNDNNNNTQEQTMREHNGPAEGIILENINENNNYHRNINEEGNNERGNNNNISKITENINQGNNNNSDMDNDTNGDTEDNKQTITYNEGTQGQENNNNANINKTNGDTEDNKRTTTDYKGTEELTEQSARESKDANNQEKSQQGTRQPPTMNTSNLRTNVVFGHKMELPKPDNTTCLISMNINGIWRGDNYQDVLEMA